MRNESHTHTHTADRPFTNRLLTHSTREHSNTLTYTTSYTVTSKTIDTMRIFNSLSDTVVASAVAPVDDLDSSVVLQDVQVSTASRRRASVMEHSLSRIQAGGGSGSDDDDDCRSRQTRQSQRRRYTSRTQQTPDLLQGQPDFRRRPVWGMADDRQLPRLRDVQLHRDGDDGSRPRDRQRQQAPRRDSVRAPSSRPSDEQPQSCRWDRRYHGSRLPVPCRRQAPAPEQIPRSPDAPHSSKPDDAPALAYAPALRRRTNCCPRRAIRDESAAKSSKRCTFDLPPVDSSSCDIDLNRSRRDTYEVPSVTDNDSQSSPQRYTYDESPTMNDHTQRSRRDTYDVPPTINDTQKSRRDTHDVTPATNDCTQSSRLDTYDVAPMVNDCTQMSSRQNTYEPPTTNDCMQRSLRDTYDVTPTTNNHFQRSVQQSTYEPPTTNDCTQKSRRDTYDVQAPVLHDDSALKFRCESYPTVSISFDVVGYGNLFSHDWMHIHQDGHAVANIDPDAFNVSTPEHWRRMINDRDSIGSQQVLSIDDSTPARSDDQPRTVGRDSRPFGLDESSTMRPSTSRHSSRATFSDRRQLRASHRHDGCQRDTFDRKTH